MASLTEYPTERFPAAKEAAESAHDAYWHHLRQQPQALTEAVITQSVTERYERRINKDVAEASQEGAETVATDDLAVIAEDAGSAQATAETLAAAETAPEAPPAPREATDEEKASIADLQARIEGLIKDEETAKEEIAESNRGADDDAMNISIAKTTFAKMRQDLARQRTILRVVAYATSLPLVAGVTVPGLKALNQSLQLPLLPTVGTLVVALIPCVIGCFAAYFWQLSLELHRNPRDLPYFAHLIEIYAKHALHTTKPDPEQQALLDEKLRQWHSIRCQSAVPQQTHLLKWLISGVMVVSALFFTGQNVSWYLHAGNLGTVNAVSLAVVVLLFFVAAVASMTMVSLDLPPESKLGLLDLESLERKAIAERDRRLNALMVHRQRLEGELTALKSSIERDNSELRHHYLKLVSDRQALELSIRNAQAEEQRAVTERTQAEATKAESELKAALKTEVVNEHRQSETDFEANRQQLLMRLIRAANEYEEERGFTPQEKERMRADRGPLSWQKLGLHVLAIILVAVAVYPAACSVTEIMQLSFQYGFGFRLPVAPWIGLLVMMAAVEFALFKALADGKMIDYAVRTLKEGYPSQWRDHGYRYEIRSEEAIEKETTKKNWLLAFCGIGFLIELTLNVLYVIWFTDVDWKASVAIALIPSIGMLGIAFPIADLTFRMRWIKRALSEKADFRESRNLSPSGLRGERARAESLIARDEKEQLGYRGPGNN